VQRSDHGRHNGRSDRGSHLAQSADSPARRRSRFTRSTGVNESDVMRLVPAWYPALSDPVTDTPVAWRPGCPHRSSSGISREVNPMLRLQTPLPERYRDATPDAL